MGGGGLKYWSTLGNVNHAMGARGAPPAAAGWPLALAHLANQMLMMKGRYHSRLVELGD